MKYIIAILVAIAGMCLAYVTLDIDLVKRIHLFDVKNEEERNEVKLEKKKIYIICMSIFMLMLICSLKINSDNSEMINICKLQTALLILAGSACFDYREHRIPNIFPLLMSVFAVVCLVIGIITEQDGAIAYVNSSVFACIGCAVCLTVAAFLTKQGIGAGDIKLLSSLALLGGVYLTCGVLFFAVVGCSVVAIILLVTKKETLKSTVPFAPFILIGFIGSIFMSIY